MNKILLGFSIIILLTLQACGGGSGSNTEDTTPDAFYFTDQYGLGLGIWVESNTFEVTGIDADAEISIEDGEYSINGADWTDADGTISEGQNVTVRVLTSDDLYTSSSTTLTIGGVEDTFNVRTTSLGLSVQYNFKGLSFSWQTVSGATAYRLLYQASSDDEFVQYGRDFDSNTTGTRIELPVHNFNWFDAQFKLEVCADADCFTTQSIGVVSERANAVGYFKAENPDEFDGYGVVTISGDGNTLAIAAPAEDGQSGIDGDMGDNEVSAAGAVYVYTKVNQDWIFQSYIKAPKPEAGDEFGYALALSGDGTTLAVAAPYEDGGSQSIDGDDADNSAADSGAVFVYKRVGDIWLQQSYIKASDGVAGDLFGSSVALSTYGETLAVSAPSRDTSSGAVYVFAAASESWQEQAQITAPNAEVGDYFGAAVSLTADGDQLLVGAPDEGANSVGVNADMADNNSVSAGAAYLFDRAAESWSFSQYIKASNTAAGQLFGTAVSISADGSAIAIGAPGESSSAYGVDGDQSDSTYPSAGAAYVFEKLASDDWVQSAYVKASDGDAGDMFGANVALNANGELLVVSAPGEASANTEVDSNDSDDSAPDAGAAYVYGVSDGEWQYLSYVKAPNAEEGDGFGTSLSLDASGDSLVVGAPEEDSSSSGVAANKFNNLAQNTGAAYLF